VETAAVGLGDHVAEGVPAARAARELAAKHGVDMPIATAVEQLLRE